jgi:hypothetical protein
LRNRKITKIFHYGRFDLGVLYHSFGIMPEPVFCTKIASRLTRTYTDRHGLKDICAELLGVTLSKVQQSSDWAVETLTPEQLEYAASMFSTCIGCATSWQRVWRATDAPRKRMPASVSCRPAPGSI